MSLELKELTIKDIDAIKEIIFDIFTKEPWNDDWSDKNQFHEYIIDLIGNKNSLVLALFEDCNMIGISIGRIKHWYYGTEYFIDDIGIKPQKQGSGVGSAFIQLIETFIKQRGIKRMFLITDREILAYHFYKKNGFIELESNVCFKKLI